LATTVVDVERRLEIGVEKFVVGSASCVRDFAYNARASVLAEQAHKNFGERRPSVPHLAAR